VELPRCVSPIQIWPQVKAANPHLSSVTEIGAVVGAMWRDLDPAEKQRYNDQFNREKVTLDIFQALLFLSCSVFSRAVLSQQFATGVLGIYLSKYSSTCLDYLTFSVN